jgi:hypothetical protein
MPLLIEVVPIEQALRTFELRRSNEVDEGTTRALMMTRPCMILLLLCSTMLELTTPCPVVAAEGGAGVFAAACSACHNPNRRPLDKMRMTREKWKENIDRMIEQDNIDPLLTKEQYSALLGYLASTQGPTATPTPGTGTDQLQN